jgi:pyridine nucleotide-disulfide oxidoreductase
MDASASKKRILILGGGFGGVATACHLEGLFRRRPDVEIVLVSRDNFLLMTSLLFEAFSGALDLRSCSFPVRAFLRTTRFVEATVQGIDLDRRVVRLASPGKRGELADEQLVLALGSKTNRDIRHPRRCAGPGRPARGLCGRTHRCRLREPPGPVRRADGAERRGAGELPAGVHPPGPHQRRLHPRPNAGRRGGLTRGVRRNEKGGKVNSKRRSKALPHSTK